jgi:ketosteroid isomerase-like protein
MSIPDAARTAMQQTNALFESSVVRNREFGALDFVYTADARILPPGADLIQGRAAIKQFWEQAIASLTIKEAKLSTVDAEEAGTNIIEIGRAELTLEGGNVIAVKYVVQWKEEDGTWKWHTDIWNTNQ